MAKRAHRLKISLPLDPYRGSIRMDGKPMKGVSRIDMAVAPGELVKVRLTMLAYVEVDGDIKESEIIHVERP